MTSLERDLLPAIQSFGPARAGSLDVILGAVMKATCPATRFSPIDENAYIPEAILPVIEDLSFGRENIFVRHSSHSHSIVPGGFEVTSYTTRLTPFTSLMMRVAVVPRNAASNG